MKTLEQIKFELSALESRFGFNPLEVAQGSHEWHLMKLGVPSASNADAILAGKTTAKRLGYMATLVGQVATGLYEEISAKPLAWGKEHEDAARAMYEFDTGRIVTELPVIFKNADCRALCSPDGYGERGLELKVPYSTRTYIEFLTENKIKPEYNYQCQFSMWITDAELWDFGNHDPRMKRNQLKIKTLERDEKLMSTFDDAVAQFNSEMDKMLESAGFVFGEHWERLKNEREKKRDQQDETGAFAS